jgi:signal transduction histidine kinase
MAKACRAIMDGDLKARIPVRGTQDELDRLAGTINEMLARIAALMENLRQVTTDIAHDLRTPVSHLRNRLERARSECQTLEAYAQELNAAIVKADEILGLFSALLRVAQIEGGARRAAFDTIELGPLLTHIRELFDPVADEAGDCLLLLVRDHATVHGDRALLIQTLSNLVENAILHTPSGTNIEISLSRVDNKAVVMVRDNGPGVPEDEYPKLFRRLYRGEASRTRPGYGLGLSLVKAVAELHGATLQILNDPGLGLAVEISLPLQHEP